jgi:hypothetical protein
MTDAKKASSTRRLLCLMPKSKNALEAWAEGQKRGGARAGQPTAEQDHRSGNNVRSSPPSARENVIDLHESYSVCITHEFSLCAGRHHG